MKAGANGDTIADVVLHINVDSVPLFNHCVMFAIFGSDGIVVLGS